MCSIYDLFHPNCNIFLINKDHKLYPFKNLETFKSQNIYILETILQFRNKVGPNKQFVFFFFLIKNSLNSSATITNNKYIPTSCVLKKEKFTLTRLVFCGYYGNTFLSKFIKKWMDKLYRDLINSIY